jgi:hypothetical protein
MVYMGMAIVPAVAGITGFVVLRAVHRRSISALASCLVFIVAVAAGMLLSFTFVWGFSDLLHGDGALAIIAAPVTGAILSIPIALIFALGLAVIASNRARPRADQSC